MSAQESIRFDGRVAIVTGAGKGLGRAYALELAKRGASVVVNNRGGLKDDVGQAPSADMVVEEIIKAGGRAVANYDSVDTVAGGEAIVKTALDEFGKLDILINNAGFLRDRSLAKMSPEDWDAVLKVHLYGAYHVSRPAFAAMRESQYGRIVMTTSDAGLYGNFGQTNYSAAKMGIIGFTNSLKLEGAKYDIKVNAVAPAAATRLTEGTIPAEYRDMFRPELVVPLTLFLCSAVCPVSGHIYNASSGHFNRIAVVGGPAVWLYDGTRQPTVEDVAENWARIDSLEGAKPYTDMYAAGKDVPPMPKP